MKPLRMNVDQNNSGCVGEVEVAYNDWFARKLAHQGMKSSPLMLLKSVAEIPGDHVNRINTPLLVPDTIGQRHDVHLISSILDPLEVLPQHPRLVVVSRNPRTN